MNATKAVWSEAHLEYVERRVVDPRFVLIAKPRRSPRASVAPVTSYARVKIAELIDAALTNPTAKDCGVTDHQRSQVKVLRQQMNDIVTSRFDVKPAQERDKP